MTITFLGTGTSCGVPFIGCNCTVCTSTNQKDKRLRSSALIQVDNKTILIDCGPDFRQQMLSVPFAKIDGVLITHEHYDHVGGLDDLRPYMTFGEVNVYSEDFCATHLEERIPYCFTPKDKRYPGVPAINLVRIKPHTPFFIDNVEIIPIRVMHGKLPILGFRIKNMAYITDMKTIDDEELQYLKGIKTLIVNALRHKEHGSHQTLNDAIQFSKKIGAEHTYLIHLSQDFGLHSEEQSKLPPNIHIAYDNLKIHC